MLATLSRWRRGFKSHRGRLIGAVRNWQSGEAQTFVILWVRLPPASLILDIARAPPARQTFVIANKKASAGHGRAQVAVTHPPSGIGGSTPSRRTGWVKGQWLRVEGGKAEVLSVSQLSTPNPQPFPTKWCNW